MSVWLTVPSKRPINETAERFEAWVKRGYKIAVWVDPQPQESYTRLWEWEEYFSFVPQVSICAPYPGYARAVNHLIRVVMDADVSAEWFVCAGDDTEPDPNHSAEEIARECSEHFATVERITDRFGDADTYVHETFGVMQPTGDRWHEGVGGFANAPIDRVAGSPWIGREFARRMYQGNGPYWPEYTHCFVDEELQHVAEKLGVFWQRRDLTHLHRNWARGSHDKEIVSSDRMPEFLKEANSAEHWRKYKALFEARKAAGFPGHEPI